MKSLLALLTLAGVAHAAPYSVTSKTRTVEIKDEAWGIVAFRMDIPADWKFEGVLLRDPYCGASPSIAYRLTSPDGLAGYQVLPQFIWHSSDDPLFLKAFRQFHCKIMDPMTPAEFLTYVAPAIRPAPAIGEIGPTVDAKQFDQMIAQYNDRMAQQHMGGRESGGGVRSIITYTFHDQPIEENLRVVVQTFTNPMGAHQSVTSTADMACTRAPKGQLVDLAKAIGPLIGKGGMTNEWMQRLQRKMADDQTRAMAQIKHNGEVTASRLKASHDAYMKQSKESFEKSQAVVKANADARHRANVAWTLYAGDEQLVKNPKTGEVMRVTNQNGTHGHQDSVSGDVVMTTDPNFDPSYYVRGSWTQLENVDP
jgi:hypothetical protein